MPEMPEEFRKCERQLRSALLDHARVGRITSEQASMVVDFYNHMGVRLDENLLRAFGMSYS